MSNKTFGYSERKENIGSAPFNGTAEMFGLSENPAVIMLPVDSLIENVNHPFKVADDEQLRILAESIKRDSMIQPVIVRRLQEKYEILSGHRRTLAIKKLGVKIIKAIVIDADDELADKILIATNFWQRNVILPSEIAKSYRLRYRDLKRYQAVSDPNSPGGNGDNSRFDKIMEKEFQTSKTNIYRYLRINHLIEELIEVLDKRKLKIKTAVQLSYLRLDEQAIVYDYVFTQKAFSIDYKQAAELKRKSTEKALDDRAIKLVLTRPVIQKLTTNIFNNCDLKKYIRKFDSIEVMKKAVFDFLESYEREV